METLIGFRARLLTPMAFHGLMVDSGSATIADVLSDKAMAFAITESLGWMPAGVGLPPRPNYRTHLAAMPFRTSLFMPAPDYPTPRLGFPQVRKLNIDAEGGRLSSLAAVTSSGNVKDYFTVQEVQPGAVYEGMIAWRDGSPDLPQQWVVRTGLGRQAQVLLERTAVPERVVLNAHTASVFNRPLPCERFYLHTLQAAPSCSADQAAAQMQTWN